MADPTASMESVFFIQAQRRPGVVARIATVFDRRALDIRRLRAEPGDQAGVGEIVVHVCAETETLTRIAAAIRNLVDVLAVDLRHNPEV
jgi:acetolactate synthase small subunit